MISFIIERDVWDDFICRENGVWVFSLCRSGVVRVFPKAKRIEVYDRAEIRVSRTPFRGAVQAKLTPHAQLLIYRKPGDRRPMRQEDLRAMADNTLRKFGFGPRRFFIGLKLL